MSENTWEEKFNDVLDKAKLFNADRFRLIDIYLTLMENCLTGSIYEDAPINAWGLKEYDSNKRDLGQDWPSSAHTMIGRKRVRNLRLLVEDVLRNRIAGDFIETGVWRGGSCILMKAILNAYSVVDRKVWVADSFEGLPPPDEITYPADAGDAFHTFEDLAVSKEKVSANFEKYGLLDERVIFLKGWFKDTLSVAPIEKLAILRMDGDMYESTMAALNALYDKVTAGGYVIVDDYHAVKACKQAITEFRVSRSIHSKIEEIDGTGVFWKV